MKDGYLNNLEDHFAAITNLEYITKSTLQEIQYLLRILVLRSVLQNDKIQLPNFEAIFKKPEHKTLYYLTELLRCLKVLPPHHKRTPLDVIPIIDHFESINEHEVCLKLLFFKII